NGARKPSQRTTARAGRQQILDPAAVEKPPRERAARTARQLSKRAVPESETRKQIAATDTQCRGDLRLIVEMLETGTPSGGDYIFILQPHLHHTSSAPKCISMSRKCRRRPALCCRPPCRRR